MNTSDLLTLMDREAQALADENNHSAAAIMREAAAHLRRFHAGASIRAFGGSVTGSFRIDTGPEEMFKRQNRGQ